MVGVLDGAALCEGADVGTVDGKLLSCIVGTELATSVGELDGEDDGSDEGTVLATLVGNPLGLVLAILVGA